MMGARSSGRLAGNPCTRDLTILTMLTRGSSAVFNDRTASSTVPFGCGTVIVGACGEFSQSNTSCTAVVDALSSVPHGCNAAGRIVATFPIAAVNVARDRFASVNLIVTGVSVGAGANGDVPIGIGSGDVGTPERAGVPDGG